MHLYIGVLASQNDIYDKFKENWIKHINNTVRKIKSKEINLELKIYFLYDGSSENNIIQHENYADLYCNCEENLANMIIKTLIFFETINPELQNTKDDVFILRTNLSSVFNFIYMYWWILQKQIPQYNFFGGPFIDRYNEKKNKISGTCMLLTKDIINLLCINKPLYTKLVEELKYSYLDDILLSALIIDNLEIYTINIKRLDLVINKGRFPGHDENSTILLYHNCNINDNDIFCFRFKSYNRNHDIDCMNILIDQINDIEYAEYNKILQKYNIKHVCEHPIGELYSRNIFKL